MQVAMSTQHRAGVLASAASAPWVRAGEGSSRKAVRALLERFGLTAWANVLTDELSTGTRRICDLAAQVAAGPKVLLLDEPTGGVAQREAEAFGPLLRSIRDELGLSVLIVEHDMPLLMGLCDRIYAMDQGRVISAGTPEQVRADPAVIVSYLGTDEAPTSPPTRQVPVRQGARASSAEDGRRTRQVPVPQEAEEAPAGSPTRRVRVPQHAEDEAEDGPSDSTPSEGTQPLRERPLRARPLRAR
jgi:ABC-type multidrug transport system ATPase subunit